MDKFVDGPEIFELNSFSLEICPKAWLTALTPRPELSSTSSSQMPRLEHIRGQSINH